VIVIIALYLQARQRSRAVAYVLARQMGLSRSGHWRAVVTELGVILGWSVLVGGTLGLVAARLVISRLDPPTAIPPSVFVWPTGMFIATACTAGAASLVVGFVVQLSADRTNVQEVIRVAP
jgi:putative ABC transport system permease protein